MMYLEAIKERNAKPERQPRLRETIDSDVRRGRLREAMMEHVSPMASIDAAPAPEYMQGR